MKHSYVMATLCAWLPALTTQGQVSFTDRTDLIEGTFTSAVCMAATDLNGDGRDDILVMNNGRQVVALYQNVDGRYTRYDHASYSASQWGMAVADLDNDGHKDVFSGGTYDNTHIQFITAPSTANGVDLTASLFTQCVSLGDMDDNGWLDLFACDDNDAPKTWLNDNGTFTLEQIVDFATTPESDMSGNYGSVFTDFDQDGDIDFYLAHCRQGVNDPNDPRRWDRLFVNDGTGHFTDEAAARGVLNNAQTWAVDFGDWDNDGDYDLVTVNHDRDMQFMENDGTGHFTEISDNGLDLVGFLLEVHMEDFDNDGLLDILATGGPHYFLQGHGDGTFTRVDGILDNNGKALQSFAIGDLNDDGAMDIRGSYGNGYVTPDQAHPDILWMNDGNANHWLNVKLEGVESNRDAIGARVVLTTPLGTQVREVRAGESYGLTNTSICHFGLGTHTEISSVTIHWPSGQVDTYSDIEADQGITFIEGRCIAPMVHVASPGGYSLCGDGDPLTLSAHTTAGSLAWSTGETTAAIIVDEPGYYTVTADAGDGCTAMNSVFIRFSGGAPPTIEVDGRTGLCPGEQVVLTSSPASGYAWNNGATTQSITVDSPGDYSVTVVDGCPGLLSDTVTVTALSAPEAPTSADVSIPAPGTAVLIASQNDVVWYDVAVGGSAVGTGSPWTTPMVNADVTFWCAAPGDTTQVTYFGGEPDISPQASEENSNLFFPLFEALLPFTLKSVKVHAQQAGLRTIALVAWPDGTVISSTPHNLPAGESRVELDLAIPVGTFGLRVQEEDPALTYEANAAYPYPLGPAGNIIGIASPNGTVIEAYYELFYDWEIETAGVGCWSERTAVHVYVGPTGTLDATAAGAAVYPVPAHEALNITFGAITGMVDVDLLDLTGRQVSTRRMNASGVQQLDLTGVAPGGYGLRIRHADGTTLKRILVE